MVVSRYAVFVDMLTIELHDASEISSNRALHISCLRSLLLHALLLMSWLRHMMDLQVGRAGRFGTKGLAITFVSSPSDSEVLNQVRSHCDSGRRINTYHDYSGIC